MKVQLPSLVCYACDGVGCALARAGRALDVAGLRRHHQPARRRARPPAPARLRHAHGLLPHPGHALRRAGPHVADERPGRGHAELAEQAVARGEQAGAQRLGPPLPVPRRPAQHPRPAHGRRHGRARGGGAGACARRAQARVRPAHPRAGRPATGDLRDGPRRAHGARRLYRRADAGRVTPMGTLVLLRHGQSVWNAENLFTGWVDVPLSETGEQEARRGGELLRAENLLPDVVHTSLLRRAIDTANLALDACDRHWIPVRRDWRLNERHYGALQGKNKKQTLDTYGEEQFMLWRRSYSVPPPPIEPGSEFSQDADPRYADLGADMPATECLADVVARFLPYWESAVVPDLREGKVVLLAAHGNSLRALVKHLDGVSDEAIAGLNIPTGIPLRYELDDDLRPTVAGGTYLDPEAAKEAAAAVAAQGR